MHTFNLLVSERREFSELLSDLENHGLGFSTGVLNSAAIEVPGEGELSEEWRALDMKYKVVLKADASNLDEEAYAMLFDVVFWHATPYTPGK